MKKILAFILALSMVLALSACGGSAAAPGNNTPSDAAPSDSAQEQAPVTIQMTYPPSANATTDLEMQWVRDKVLEATDGKVTFELYPGSSLATDKVALDSIMTGTLDSAGVTLNSLAQTIPELNTRCLPFSFDSIEQYWKVMQSNEYHEKMTETFDNGNVKKCAVGKHPKSEKLGSTGQAACCARIHSRYFTGGSPSGLRV